MGSVDEIYTLLAEDLKEAIPNLPDSRPSSEIYKIRKGMHKHFWERFTQYHRQYQEAANQFNEVIMSY